jgi:GGDEF domain-containing protein
LFCLYNVERLHSPINIASFTYPFVAMVAAATVLIPRLAHARAEMIFAVAASVFLGVKYWLGYRMVGTALPLTLSELVAIGATLALARAITMSLWGVEQAVAAAMVEHLGIGPVPFSAGQEQIYREIRRARQFRRPFSLLAIGTDGPAAGPQFSALLERIQRENIGRYLAAQLAHLVAVETKGCDIVTRRNGHFVVALPEASSSDAERIVKRIAQVAGERLGVRLRVGYSTFPDQEVTFDRLLARAEGAMRACNGVANGGLNGQNHQQADGEDEAEPPPPTP